MDMAYDKASCKGAKALLLDYVRGGWSFLHDICRKRNSPMRAGPLILWGKGVMFTKCQYFSGGLIRFNLHPVFP